MYVCMYIYVYIFCPVAVETMGPIDEESMKLLSAITEHTGEPRESQFLYQRLSIIIQRGNAASFKGSFFMPCPDAI